MKRKGKRKMLLFWIEAELLWDEGMEGCSRKLGVEVVAAPCIVGQRPEYVGWNEVKVFGSEDVFVFSAL